MYMAKSSATAERRSSMFEATRHAGGADGRARGVGSGRPRGGMDVVVLPDRSAAGESLVSIVVIGARHPAPR